MRYFGDDNQVYAIKALSKILFPTLKRRFGLIAGPIREPTVYRTRDTSLKLLTARGITNLPYFTISALDWHWHPMLHVS